MKGKGKAITPAPFWVWEGLATHTPAAAELAAQAADVASAARYFEVTVFADSASGSVPFPDWLQFSFMHACIPSQQVNLAGLHNQAFFYVYIQLDRKACSLDGLLLGTEAPSMKPNGVDFSFLAPLFMLPCLQDVSCRSHTLPGLIAIQGSDELNLYTCISCIMVCV